MTRHKITLAAVLAIAAGSAAACGPGQPRAAMNQAFLHRLNRVCTADFAVMINTSKDPFPYPDFKPDDPQPGMLPKVGRFFEPNVAVWQRLPGQLGTLGEPPTLAAGWDRLRQLEAKSNANGIRQVHAALAGDARTFTATYHIAHTTYQQVQDAEQQAGLPASSPCQKVFS
ncbi:MAG TPA: hypothetical protein VH637_16400 [Streptosporangiaceae bacterium]